MARKRVMVVGGGVIAAACAYYLARRDWAVTIVERGRYGQGCSHGNGGLIVLSHVLPLNEPGLATKTLLAMFSKQSSFHVPFAFDWQLWAWLWRFARHCRQDRVLAAARACATLLSSSGQLFRTLFADEPIDCEWQQRGCLLVYRTALEMERYAKTDGLLREHFGIAATRHNGDSVTVLESALKTDLAGGWYYDMDAQLRPEKLLAGWRQVLEQRGVVIREKCEVQGLTHAGGRAQALQTPDGEMAAEAFVLATGELTPLLVKDLHCRVPILPGKGYSLTMPRPANCPRIPLLLQEHGVAVAPMQSGYRLASTMDFVGYDKTLDRRRLEALKKAAGLYLHDPYNEPIEEEWCGWRTMTYDGKPIIGPSPALPNVFLATGHNLIGLTMAPATGRLIAELVNQEPPHLDPAAFAPARFR